MPRSQGLSDPGRFRLRQDLTPKPRLIPRQRNIKSKGSALKIIKRNKLMITRIAYMSKVISAANFEFMLPFVEIYLTDYVKKLHISGN